MRVLNGSARILVLTLFADAVRMIKPNPPEGA